MLLLPFLLGGASLASLASGLTLPRQLTFSPSAEHDPIDVSKYTIGQILDWTLKHAEDESREHPPLRKLAYIVNQTEEIKDLLHDSSVQLTLFAPDDEALKMPEHGHDHGDNDGHGLDSDDDLSEEHRYMLRNHPMKTYTSDSVSGSSDGTDSDSDSDKEKERRRAFIKKIVTAILHYHISSEHGALSLSTIQDSATLPSNLTQVRDAHVPFRIRVSTNLDFFPPPPSFSTSLNFYAKLRKAPAIIAKNGIIHLISAPLLPPITPLDQLFLFPNAFATLTSAIQQTELDHSIAPYLHAGHEGDHKKDETNSAVLDVLQELVQEAKAALLPSKDTYKAFPFTIFAPTNFAFAKIPFKLRLFLFSPFGKPILKKLLSFHVIPQVLFHSDYLVNATRGSEKSSLDQFLMSTSEVSNVPGWCSSLLDGEPTSLAGAASFPSIPGFPGSNKDHDDKDKPCPPKSGTVRKYEFPTLLGALKNQSLAINVYEYRKGLGGKGPLERTISVGNTELKQEDEYTKVFVRDGVAWGGSVHVVNSIIRPVIPEHHHEGDHDHDHEHHEHGPRGPRGPRGPHGPRHEHDHHLEYFRSLLA